MPNKNINKIKKPEQIMIWKKTRKFKNIIKKLKLQKTVLIKSKIFISQLIANILLEKWSLNQIRNCLTKNNQIWHDFFYQKILKVFRCLSKSTFLRLITISEPKKWKINKIRHFSMGYLTSLNLTLFVISCKKVKYFSVFYSYHFSISLQDWAQSSKVK